METRYALNFTHHGARLYFPDLGRFASPDPLAGETPQTATYLYCGANPVNFIDPTGKNYYDLDIDGNFILTQENNDTFDRITSRMGNNPSIDIDKSFIASQIEINNVEISSITYGNSDGSIYIYNSIDDISELYRFLIDNSDVEWSYMVLTDSEDNQFNYIGTTHNPQFDASQDKILSIARQNGQEIKSAQHNHSPNSVCISDGDVKMAQKIEEYSPNAKCSVVFSNSSKPPLYFDSDTEPRTIQEVTVIGHKHTK